MDELYMAVVQRGADPYDTAKVLRVLTQDLKLTICSLRQVGWMDLNDHSLAELDADEDTRPPDAVPVWQTGRVAYGLPAVDFLGDGE